MRGEKRASRDADGRRLAVNGPDLFHEGARPAPRWDRSLASEPCQRVRHDTRNATV